MDNKSEVVVVAENETDLKTKVTEYLERILKQSAADKKDRPHAHVIVGLSGGRMPKLVGPILRDMELDWSMLRFFSLDERMVPLTDPESNTGAYHKYLPPEAAHHFPQFGPIDCGKTCAANYAAHIKAWHPDMLDGYPVIDLLLLGLGPDGHTCSLFPNHPLLKEEQKWMTWIDDSPKAPSRRITVTMPLINRARHVAFIATDVSKAPVIKAIIKDGSKEYPGGLVRPKNGDLYWFLDKGAASQL